MVGCAHARHTSTGLSFAAWCLVGGAHKIGFPTNFLLASYRTDERSTVGTGSCPFPFFSSLYLRSTTTHTHGFRSIRSRRTTDHPRCVWVGWRSRVIRVGDVGVMLGNEKKRNKSFRNHHHTRAHTHHTHIHQRKYIFLLLIETVVYYSREKIYCSERGRETPFRSSCSSSHTSPVRRHRKQ